MASVSVTSTFCITQKNCILVDHLCFTLYILTVSSFAVCQPFAALAKPARNIFKKKWVRKGRSKASKGNIRMDHHHHHEGITSKGHHMDAYTFKYVYTCDIEEIGFRVKVGNLDGIFPPSAQTDNAPSKRQQSPQSHNKSHYSSSSTIQNNYNYNVVEVLEELSLIDDLASSDEESSSTQEDAASASPKSTAENTDSIPLYVESLNKRQKEHKSQQKKSQKLSQIIFGGLSQPVRALSCHPFITCDLVSNGQRLCPPQQTQYKQMTKRYEWNEWLLFSLTLDTLPRDTRVCFTVWDTVAPGKMAAVARTSIALFSKHGCLRRGIYDLRLYFNDDCDESIRGHENGDKVPPPSLKQASSSPSSSSTEIAFSDLDFNHRDHRNKHLITPEGDFVLNGYNTPNNVNKDTSVKHTPPQKSKFDSSANGSDTNSLNFTSTTQYMQNDLSLYPDGNCGLSKKVKQLNKLKKKYYNGQIPKVTWLDKLTFLKIEHIIVDEKTISTLVFLTVEFPVVVLDGVEHCVVYYEDKEEHCCQYDIIEKEIVTIQDPEISLDNLVEQKHHKLARSARSGISDRDLKPNATIRNQLNDIVSCPSTKLLTSEEQDLVWKFRFYLCTQKKALTKFLKTVNWNSPSEVEQAINLMEDWAPMDVEDALELLSPQFRHPIVRKYAVSRLKEAVDEELLLYLLQLVQALKYESFIDIHRSFDSELTEYRSKPQAANVPPTSEAEGSKGTRKLFEEGPHSTVESFLAESIKMFSAPPNLETFGEGRTSDSIPPYSSTNSLSAGGDGSSLVVQHGEQLTSKNSSNKYGEDLATFLINRACSNDSLANYLFWYLMVECDGVPKSDAASSSSNSSFEQGSPHNSIISSAYTTSYLVPPTSPPVYNNDSYLKWNRDSSSPTSSVVKMYQTMMMRFSLRLFYGGQEMFARRNFLIRQYKFVEKLVVIMKDVARESGNRTKKIEKLQTILSSPEPQHRFNFSKSDPLPLPLNPDVKIVGVVAKEATLFKSAMMPAKLAFYTTEGSIYSVIFKHGDDLRQDDLVLQMIILMDKLLRMENLDLKLTAYRVLATGSKHGFVQFIDSQSVAEVLSIDGTIQNYLRKISTKWGNKTNQPIGQPASSSAASMDFQFVSSVQSKQNESSLSTSPASHSGLPSAGSSNNLTANSIAPEVMDAYVKSCAGYCIITYLLGVGDRHLDNLMMTKTGRLFHIDFGFILGRDPKLRPPPMKITREMVDAMGGMSSENFARFCNLVRTAFLHLRRHANLILNLFSLMVDANVPDIALEPDKTVQKVQDKFKLELNDEQAVHHITEQVEQSVRSIMPVVVDQLHKMTQYLRN